MSQYTHVFARQDDTFIELGCFTRSSIISQLFQAINVPYDKIKLITKNAINEMIVAGTEQVMSFKEMMDRDKKLKEEIWQSNNSIEEKIEAIEGFENAIKETLEEIKQYEWALSFLTTIKDMIHDKEDAEHHKVLIYCGIECGSCVSKEEIV